MLIQDGKVLPQMGVVVGIPCSRPVPPEWAIALATQSWPTNTNVCYVPIRGMARDAGRELIVEGARRLRSKYVWFVDDDVEVPFGAARQLMQTMAQADDKVMAVGGIYPSRKGMPEPIVFVDNGSGPHWRWKRDTVFECSMIGIGCCLIKTEIFDYIDKPWFKDIDNEKMNVTDDAFFFAKLHVAGFKVLADAHVLCGHWDIAQQECYRLPEDSYPMLPLGKEELLKGLPKGWMSMEELDWLTSQAAKRNCIVELGSYLGRSTVAMARSTSGQVISIDDFRGVDDLHQLEPKEMVPARFKANISPYGNITHFTGDHAELLMPVTNPDMVFIDGSHDYDACKRDILNWKDRLQPGGLLCGHDREWPGVERAVNELLPGWKPGPGSLWSYA